MKFVWAFVIGGLICVIGQVLIDKTKLTPARILVGYVCAGIVLGAFGVYDKLIDFAGSGAALPLSGFGNLLVNGTREAVIRDGLLGALEGPLTAGDKLALRASRETGCFAPAEKLRSGDAEKNGQMTSACRNVVVHDFCPAPNGRDAPRRVRTASPLRLAPAETNRDARQETCM